MTRAEAIWHANHVFNIVIERCINAQNLKDAREFDEAKQIVIEALEQEPKCEDCKWNTWDNNCMVEYRGCRFEPKRESDEE